MAGGRYLVALAALTVGSVVDVGAQEAVTPVPEPPPEITIASTPVGPVFADADGYTLYVTQRDTEPDVSTCFGACTSEWPPARSSVAAKPFGDWSLVERPDGAPQWAYQGRPLYRYRHEEKKNWAIGQGDFWQIATVDPFPERGRGRRVFARSAAGSATRFAVKDAPAGIVAETTPLGVVLADPQGMTLYVGPADCKPACDAMWTPLRAPAAAVTAGDWSVIPRADGVTQWAFDGQPLYRCANDAVRGEATCAHDGAQVVEVPSALIVTGRSAS